jgi:hypothetical protein
MDGRLSGRNGYEVCARTFSEDDVISANNRIKNLEAKGLSPELKYLAVTMEPVDTWVVRVRLTWRSL